MTVVRACFDFAIANDCSIQRFDKCVEKIGIHWRGQRIGLYIEQGRDGCWGAFSDINGKVTTLPSVKSRDQLLNTLASVWTTPMQAMASLMDAKLADVHAALEKNTEALQNILDLIEHKLQRTY